MIITVFKSIKESSNPYHTDEMEIFKRIKNGNSKETIGAIRAAKDKTERNKLKQKLPSVCFSGKFAARKADQIIQHSGLITLDFDDIPKEELIPLKKKICKDKFTYACFFSPSGNGIKAIIKIPKEPENHKGYFEALEKRYGKYHEVDPSGSDVCRVCYESFDPQIFVNKDSDTFTDIVKQEAYTRSEKLPDVQLTDQDQVYAKLKTWWKKENNFVEGGRNHNLFKLASSMNRYGLAKFTAEVNLVQDFESTGFDAAEIKQIVDSAYSHSDQHNTEYFEDNKSIKIAKDYLKQGKSKEEVKEILKTSKKLNQDQAEKVIRVAEKYSSSGIVSTFWDIQKTGKKGEEVYKISLNRRDFKYWLEQHGFFRYKYEKNSHIYIHIENNVVKEIDLSYIRNFVHVWIECIDFELEHITPIDLWEFMAKGVSVYFSEPFMDLLAEKEIIWNEDTAEEAYFYFNNCVVQVTKENINILEYLDMDGVVWATQILNRDFKEVDLDKATEGKNNFMTFLSNIAGVNSPSHNDNNRRLEALWSFIGYFLHSYKDKSKAWCGILNDEIMDDNPNGGVGKGLLVNALSEFKKVISIDGKRYNPDKTFLYQRVNFDTQIICLEDVKKNFDFEMLFSMITDGISVEKKGMGEFYIPFQSSPKLIMTTNYAIKGEGNSHNRRKIEIELSNYYSEDLSPIDDFKERFFDDWDDEAWLNFDNVMTACCSLYLRKGFIRPSYINLQIKKFKTQTSSEFFDFSQSIEKHKDYDKKELMTRYMEAFPTVSTFINQRVFNRWLKSFAAYKKHTIKERHSSNVYYIKFL